MSQWSTAAFLALVPVLVSAQELPREPYSESEVFKVLGATVDQVEKWSNDGPGRGRHPVAGLRIDAGAIQKAWPAFRSSAARQTRCPSLRAGTSSGRERMARISRDFPDG